MWACSAIQFHAWEPQVGVLRPELMPFWRGAAVLPLYLCFSGLPETMARFQTSDVSKVRRPPLTGLGSDPAGSRVSQRYSCLLLSRSHCDMSTGEGAGDLLLMYIPISGLGSVDFPLLKLGLVREVQVESA